MKLHSTQLRPWHGAWLALLLSLVIMRPSSADTLWYNGDNDHLNGLLASDSTDSAGFSATVYDDFNVTSAGGWNVDGAYGTFLYTSDTVTPLANWTILSGVSGGNAGTVVASGTSTITVTPIGVDHQYTIDDVSITGLNVNLAPGTYWLGLQPETTVGYAYLTSTSGANAVGTPAGNDGNAFYTNDYYGVYFGSTQPVSGHDFSLAITGIKVVPEPSSYALVRIGLLAIGWKLRKRRLSI